MSAPDHGGGRACLRPILTASLVASLCVSAALEVPAIAAGAPHGRSPLTSYVNPFVGTKAANQPRNGNGNTFPGPVLPNGMIRLGPDTFPIAFTFPVGGNPSGAYDYDADRIHGFSLTRMSGAGCSTYHDVPITPTTAPVTTSPVTGPQAATVAEQYVSSFSHDDESASPGYYRVGLTQPSGDRIDVRLTSTARAAVARFRFPASTAASLLINAAASAGGNDHAEIAIDPERNEVTGSTSSGGFCVSMDTYTLYFAIVFDRPFTAHGTWRGQTLQPGSTATSDSLPGPSFASVVAGPRAQAGGYVTFDATSDHTVEMRVAISYVSVAAARQNLAAETRRRTFEQIRRAARTTWDRALASVRVRGGSLAERRRFYTALYHALIEPRTFSDADGSYLGMDGQVHRRIGRTQYTDFSGWDAYRTQMPLLAILRPRVARDVARSLVADAQQSGWLPKFSVAGSHASVNTGDPAPPAIAGIYAFGARDFDTHAALNAMVKGATVTGQTASGYVERPGLEAYRTLGYVPHELNGNILTHDGNLLTRESPGIVLGSAATTLEYAAADFATSQLARALGDATTCRTLLALSRSWRNLFNATTGYIEPRFGSGLFIPGYDPSFNDALSSQGFYEGTSAQYTWMVPFDPRGLFEMLGGVQEASRRLDAFLAQLNAGQGGANANLGNEPNSNAPWLYNWLGQPFKTQAVVRRTLAELYPDDLVGFPGNDDLGQMSAWYVMSAIGLYPAIPGTDVLALGSPLFPKITLRLARGDVVLRARGASPDVRYVDGLKLGGRRYNRPWLRFADIASGARLDYGMSSTPNPAWGADPADAPPSYDADDETACQR